MSILSQILTTKQQEIQKNSPQRPILSRVPLFLQKSTNFQIIAEIKPKSPSHGIILTDNLTNIAIDYSKFASALSVLTDKEYFGGSLGLLSKIKSEVVIPILQKDFVIDKSQIYQGYNSGADLVLIIVKILTKTKLMELIKTAVDLSMQPLIEVFDKDEISLVLEVIDQLHLDSTQYILGVNNRDLSTLIMEPNNSLELISCLPKDVLRFSLSGIATQDQITELKLAGYDGALIGYGLTKGLICY